MALMDEFKEERARLKTAPLKQKLAYFWEYYKWFVIIPLVIIIALTSYIYNLVTESESVLNGILLNIYNSEAQVLSDTLAEDFCKEYKIDTKKYQTNLNTTLSYDTKNTGAVGNYESSQALMAWISAGNVDFISADMDTMTFFCYKEYFADLREVLTKEQLEKYKPYFLYMDQAFFEKQQNSTDLDTDLSSIEYPDCTKPEDMENPIPVLIDLKQCDRMNELYNNEQSVGLGIVANGENLDTVLNFLDYIME